MSEIANKYREKLKWEAEELLKLLAADDRVIIYNWVEAEKDVTRAHVKANTENWAKVLGCTLGTALCWAALVLFLYPYPFAPPEVNLATDCPVYDPEPCEIPWVRTSVNTGLLEGRFKDYICNKDVTSDVFICFPRENDSKPTEIVP